MQMMSMLCFLRNSCSSGFLFLTPSAFHWATLSDVGCLSVALLCLSLTFRLTEAPDAKVDPFEAWGPAPSLPVIADRDDAMTKVLSVA